MLVFAPGPARDAFGLSKKAAIGFCGRSSRAVFDARLAVANRLHVASLDRPFGALSSACAMLIKGSKTRFMDFLFF